MERNPQPDTLKVHCRLVLVGQGPSQRSCVAAPAGNATRQLCGCARVSLKVPKVTQLPALPIWYCSE